MEDNMQCKSCSMPIASKDDHGNCDPENPYCKHCCDEEGKPYPRNVRVKNMIKFIMQQNYMSEEEAIKAAKEKVPKED